MIRPRLEKKSLKGFLFSKAMVAYEMIIFDGAEPLTYHVVRIIVYYESPPAREHRKFVSLPAHFWHLDHPTILLLRVLISIRHLPGFRHDIIEVTNIFRTYRNLAFQTCPEQRVFASQRASPPINPSADEPMAQMTSAYTHHGPRRESYFPEDDTPHSPTMARPEPATSPLNKKSIIDWP